MLCVCVQDFRRPADCEITCSSVVSQKRIPMAAAAAPPPSPGYCLKCNTLGHRGYNCPNANLKVCLGCYSVGAHPTSKTCTVDDKSTVKKTPVCVLCAGVGHWQYNCSKLAEHEQKTNSPCIQCGTTGHAYKDCPTMQTQTQKSKERQETQGLRTLFNALKDNAAVWKAIKDDDALLMLFVSAQSQYEKRPRN